MKFADNSTTPRRRNEPASVGDGPHFLSEDSSSHNLAEEQAETLAVAMTHNTTTIESTAPRRRGPQYYQQQQQQQQHSQSPNLVFRSEDPSRPFERDLLQRQTSSVSEEILGKEILLGLSIAGVASSILYTLFGMFHIDMFLYVRSVFVSVDGRRGERWPIIDLDQKILSKISLTCYRVIHLTLLVSTWSSFYGAFLS